jgi:GntR family transcriptional regulator, transcriptional repressor for pyruvate dehydrogenase complex
MTKRPPFSTLVASKIKELIRKKKLGAGDRIPTEVELCEKFEVSRTVVREAIARLRSEGILLARQGIGVFVADQPLSRFEVDWNAIKTLSKTILLLELRMAVETESAGLCALRRSKADAAKIRRLMEQIDAEHRDPKLSNVLYDFHFHLAIAKASKNPHIHQLLEILAPVIMPRVKPSAMVDDKRKEAYYQMIHMEHESIVVAIEKQDETEARACMRGHISRAIERLGELTRSLMPAKVKDAQRAASELAESIVRATPPPSRYR